MHEKNQNGIQFFFLMEKTGGKMAVEQYYKLWRSQDCKEE